jgi:NADH-quinone oxidoreductase subunit M
MTALLTFTIFLPLAGALLLLVVPNRDGARDGLVRQLTLGRVARGVRADAAPVARLRPGRAEFQFVERHAWIPLFGIEYYVGIDGISLLLIVLTGFLTPVSLLSSWGSVKKKVKEFSIFLLRSRRR